ncbi:helix-turn-helix transcriptional regulator [Polycladomyces sp. WAk]|uniref:Helix-turn-helix transcriptional regulator n=1 Tax=Polycladomyces zharkentensis TaxID=2807616 RepID=A0ABS2WI28_9BACL|nr:helix-turn-helix transcriptional regulator [Polycladomyces sp. WAk]MBN2909126.1 helix-turn-helix transcriptional regulator [Polycladomyces sp. WAk]
MIKVRLRSIRKARGLSQEELARRVNTTKGTISNYENGYSTPSNEMLLKLADELHTTTDYLLGRIDDPNVKINENTSETEYADLKEVLNKKRAHWGGRELTEEERKLIQRIIQAAIEREESATHTE